MSRKPTLLQIWRRDYASLTFVIRAAKSAARNGHTWGDFKRPQAQSLAARLRGEAREMMDERAIYAEHTHDKWQKDAERRRERAAAASVVAGIPNTTDPDQKV